MRQVFETASTACLVVAALAVAGASLHREFALRRPTILEVGSSAPPSVEKRWLELLDAGVLVGDARAALKIVEFGDFECPACGTFERTLRSVRAQYGADLALYYIYFPLSYHRFARPAARAAECARSVGHFGPMHDALYAAQDSLGLKSWASYAADAGIADTVEFNKCALSRSELAQVERDEAMGSDFDIRATPTVFINGWRFGTVPRDSASLAKILDRVRRGLPPVEQ